jgi:Uma2 family endonuclease
MSTQTHTVTAEELLRMPDDGFRYELVRGELKKMSPSSHQHGDVAMRFSWRLAQHVETNALGKVYAAETGFLLSSNPDTVRAPDVAFVGRKRTEEVGDIKGFWPGAPDLAVEVISPGDSYAEVEEKVFQWLDCGSRVVLVLNPQKRTVTLYRSRATINLLTEGDNLAVEEVVPGWSVEVKELFG